MNGLKQEAEVYNMPYVKETVNRLNGYNRFSTDKSITVIADEAPSE